MNALQRGSQVRFGLFLVTFAAVLGVAGLVMPVPGNFATPTTDRPDPERILG